MKILLNKYQQWFNFPLDDADINQLKVYLEQRQIGKLHFEYGNLILLICLEWCEQKEDYRSCSLIQSFIAAANKYKGNTIPENILLWKKKSILTK